MNGPDGRRFRPIDPWSLDHEGYDPGQEPLREALHTVGNGVFATRGAAPECPAGGDHYPGTYIAGIYDRLAADVSGKEIVNESIVNAPNWLPLTFSLDGGRWFSIDEVEVLEYRQTLEMRRGIDVRRLRFRDSEERETTVLQRRLVHMSLPHVAALETVIRADNWSGPIVVRSTIDGGVENSGVDRYSDLPGRHLETLDRERISDELVALRSRTVQSRIEIVEAARTRLWMDGERIAPERQTVDGEDVIGLDLHAELSRESELSVEKVVSIHTSRDDAISEPWIASVESLGRLGDLDVLERSHVLAWDELWRRFGIDMDTDERTKLVTNLHIFHLVQTASPNTIDRDVGIPARGLHGEAYRGHIFWDELFVFPMLSLRAPEIARSLLLYRYRRLDAARRLASAHGYAGAMYPWQSGSDGSEESQVVHLNPESGHWIPDTTHRQRHINVAIAYNVWQYYLATGDVEFLARYGAEMLIEIARFWASIAERNPVTDRYDIVGVVGPDEFHTDDPNWEGQGLRNNAYTNVMAAWLLWTVPKALEPLPSIHRRRIVDALGLQQEELDRWDDVSHKLTVPFHDGEIISQFEGYEALEDFDWDGYRQRYDDIQRLDRILEAEGDTPNRYKASKQADVLMLFYLLSFETLQDVFERLGVAFDAGTLNDNIDYYLARTSHGSTLSRVVHSWVLARADRRRSMELLEMALESDIADIQGGTTQEGIHLGAMSGTVDLLERGYSGLELCDDVLRFKPSLPHEIERVEFRIFYRGRWLTVEVEGEALNVSSEITSQGPITVECRGERAELESGASATFPGRSRGTA